MANTPLTIILAAMRTAGIVGVGQQANGDDTNNAFILLNWMISQWARKRWLVYHLQDLSVVSTGATSYNVGPGADISITTRPARLETAYFRQLGSTAGFPLDYPLEILNSYEDYANLSIKGLQSFPTYAFLDTNWPNAKLYVWPIPQAALYEIHIVVTAPIAQFTGLSQTLNLPGEYYAALHYNLAERLAVDYQIQSNPGLVALARDSLNVIRKANFQPSRMKMPSDLVRSGVYNPYSDRVR